MCLQYTYGASANALARAHTHTHPPHRGAVYTINSCSPAHQDMGSLSPSGSFLASWNLDGMPSCQHPLVSHPGLLVISTVVTTPNRYPHMHWECTPQPSGLRGAIDECISGLREERERKAEIAAGHSNPARVALRGREWERL